MATERKFVGTHLRKGFDDDLIKATKDLDSTSKSELIRTGLRLALGIQTQKAVEVREVRVTPVSATPKVWRPQPKI